jgi:hypothetical protein
MPLMATGGSMGDGEQMADVDAHPDAHRATEDDELQVLRELYGEPDADGVFRGEG